MPLMYRIDAGFVHVTATGDVSMPEMVAVIERVATDPAFRPSYPVLFDLAGAHYEAELGDADAFASELELRKQDFQRRFAILVPPALHFLAQMYCVLARVGGFDRMHCFTDRAKAEAWCREQS